MRFPPSRALEAIQAGKLSPGYVFFGKDVYWRDRLMAALRLALGSDPSAMAVSEYDLRGDSLNRVLEAARERSLLAPRRLLIVRNAQSLASRRRGEGEAPARARGKASSRQAKVLPQHPQSDELSAYFQDPSPDCVLVFEMTDLDLDSDDWREREKVQSRLEAVGSLCDVVLLAAPSFGDAMQLVREEAAARGCAISPEAAEQLVAGFDRDMGRIRMELEKLSACHPEPPRSGVLQIEAEDVSRLSAGPAGGSHIPLVDAIGSSAPAKALEALFEVERSGRYAPLVLLELTRYLRQLILLRENKVRDPRHASSVLWSAKLAAPQSLMPALIEQSRRIKGRHLLRAIEAAYEAEIALRSSPPSDRIILEQFVLRMLKLSGSAASSRL